MRLLALSGRRSEALAQYETCRRVLAEELDVTPAVETTRLYERIRDGELDGRKEEPAIRPDLPAQSSRPRHNLPAQLIPFVGREAVLAQIGKRLRDPDCRLLILVGPGGRTADRRL